MTARLDSLRALPRVHCQTYRQLSALKALLDAFGKKLATKEQEAALIAQAEGEG